MSDKYKVLGSEDSDWLNANLPGDATYCIPVRDDGIVLFNAPRLVTRGFAPAKGMHGSLASSQIVGLWMPDARGWIGINLNSSKGRDRWTDDYGASLQQSDSERVLGWLSGLTSGFLSEDDFGSLLGTLPVPEPEGPIERDGPVKKLPHPDGTADWTDEPGEAQPIADWTDDPAEEE